MGQTLSAPATDKVTHSGGNELFLFSLCEMQGWRITMEDAHAVVLDLDEGDADSNTFFAVYDGHGGGTVAKFAGQNVHKRLVSEDAYKEKNYVTALKRAFLGTDEDLLSDPAHTRDPSGCTAVAALVTKSGKIYVANAGDSRSVISVKGEVKPLSYDHKPSNEVEQARILGAGGYIEYGRVNGNLALSRAMGDFEFKKNYALVPENQIITSNPDVIEHQIGEDDEFFVLACDGIWDCLNSQDVVNFVRRKVYEGKELSEIGEMMCDHCLAPDTSSGAGIGCDNMTVLIIAILHGRTKEQWYEWVRDRVEKNYGYDTPKEPPRIYSIARMNSYKARRQAQEERERLRQERENNPEPEPAPMFSRLFGSGVVFHSEGISSSMPTMFRSDDSDEEYDSGDEMDAVESGRPLFGNIFGIGSDSPDATMTLKARLEEFERDEDGDSYMSDESEPPVDDGTHAQPTRTPPHPRSPSPEPDDDGETAEAPPPLPNGDINLSVQQLKPQPAGDEPSPAAKSEGFLDSSEDPLKVVTQA